MSEAGSEGPQKLSPRDRALKYIRERDAMRREKIKLPGFRDFRTQDAEIEISAATAYERVIDKMGDGGLRQAAEGLRPVMYDAARLYRFGAKYADMFVTGALLFGPSVIPALNRRLDTMSGLTRARRAVTSSVRRTPRLGVAGIPLPIREDLGVVGAHARRMGIIAGGVAAMYRFRPIEWAAKTVADVGGVAAAGGVELVNKISDRIIGVKQPETRPA